jgi:hypothetical protein
MLGLNSFHKGVAEKVIKHGHYFKLVLAAKKLLPNCYYFHLVRDMRFKTTNPHKTKSYKGLSRERGWSRTTDPLLKSEKG